MNNKLWNASLFLAFVKPMPIMVLAAIVTIIGLFDLDIVLLIGLGLWILYFSASLFCFLQMQYWIKYRCDNEDFNKLMDALTKDPDDFLKSRVEEFQKILSMPSSELLNMSEGQLIYSVCARIENSFSSDEEVATNLDKLSPPQRSVYVLFLFDSEVMNGGLLQFFLNCKREVLRHVPSSLETVGANEHRALSDEFVESNGFDFQNPTDFEKYNFDSFNSKYYDLPSLNEVLISYISSNISEF